MNVMIATPTAGGTALVAYTQTVVGACQAISDAGGRFRLTTVDGADVVISRNILAHQFLSDKTCDHILFIDSDMAVDAKVIRHILGLKKPIVGCAYAERRMDLQAFAGAMRDSDDMARARALSSNFTVRMQPGEKKIRNGVCEAIAFGFGCVLIHRSVFEALIEREVVERFVSSKLASAGIKDQVWDFFDEIRLETGDWLSEDYAFCKRVRALGDVPLLCYVGPGVGHVGQFTFGGPYIERLRDGKV